MKRLKDQAHTRLYTDLDANDTDRYHSQPLVVFRVNPRKDVMDKCFRLKVVRDRVAGEVVHISGIRSHGPAAGADVAPPWPMQRSWRTRLRQSIDAGKAGKP
jgi:hypothetical protein